MLDIEVRGESIETTNVSGNISDGMKLLGDFLMLFIGSLCGDVLIGVISAIYKFYADSRGC